MISYIYSLYFTSIKVNQRELKFPKTLYNDCPYLSKPMHSLKKKSDFLRYSHAAKIK